MTLIANVVSSSWSDVMAELADLLRARDVHPTKAVVLVPYAQLMQQARMAWIDHNAFDQSFFMPRFETTQNWASSLPSPGAAPDDIQMNGAIDSLTAASLLQRAGLSDQQNDLTGRLVDAAMTLAPIAAAQPPDSRLAWGTRLASEIGVGMQGPALMFELAVARTALAWAAASSYPTDVLFSSHCDLLVVIEGFQRDPLLEALKAHWGERAASLQLKTPQTQGALALHAAPDLEREAHLAAACVLVHLAAGRSPVALVAQDRLLTRRVRAMLAGKGVLMRDETGWKLSTTRAAATLMGLLRAMPWDASTDTVLNWIKNAPALDVSAVAITEAVARKLGVSQWSAVPIVPTSRAELTDVCATVDRCRSTFQSSRPIADWLRELCSALQCVGQWTALTGDAAGLAVIEALHLGDAPALSSNPQMSLQEFTQWISQALEAASFTPAHPANAQVVILPLSQLLGRPVQAVVLPGCDEVRLAVCPEPAGAWTAAQRTLLGLPTRDTLAQNQRAAWQYALTMPHLDVLWRLSESGENLMPSGFVQELLLRQTLALLPTGLAHDPRPLRLVAIAPVSAPQASAQALPVVRLSASAYDDLRACPYRFFSLRQLGLQEADELQSGLGKRDFGSWLHLLLNIFQDALKNASNKAIAQTNKGRIAMLNIAAEAATETLGLSAEEFLPFAASWPRVRDGYLDWLAVHEASGATYIEGEVSRRIPLGRLELVGKIDRIDQLPDGSRVVMDYKTEARDTTQGRLDNAGEDTQLAFYAALLEDDTLTAAYINLGEKVPTKTYAQPDIVELRDDLISGIIDDMERIAAGALLPALGEGKVCGFCAARGLCRKDFWS